MRFSWLILMIDDQDLLRISRILYNTAPFHSAGKFAHRMFAQHMDNIRKPSTFFISFSWHGRTGTEPIFRPYSAPQRYWKIPYRLNLLGCILIG